MNEVKTFLQEAFRLILYSLYPLFMLYVNFIILGLFVLNPKLFGLSAILVFYITTNILQSIILVYYVLLFTSEDNSTQEIFPMILETSIKKDLSRVNPFVSNNIHKHNIERNKICDICHTYKPPRAMHCDRCMRCFLKNDHHSILFDVCIAYHNYKYYFIFIVINLVRIIFVTTIITIDVSYAGETKQTWVVFIVFLSLSIFYFILFSVSLIFNINLISKNETWFEKSALDRYIKGDYSQTDVFQEGPILLFENSTDRTYLNPYNLGKKQNWKEVFGNNPIDWLLPLNTSLNNGMTFDKNDDDENQLLIEL